MMFATEGEEEADEKVNEVEITYIDPSSGEVCRRQVYCDPDDWKLRYQARLLVSSELVNSLSEAVSMCHSRFWQLHVRLEDSRFGYYCGLHTLRNDITRLLEVQNRASISRTNTSPSLPDLQLDDAVEDVELPAPEKEEEEEGPKEVCPVHFFDADRYLDSWTKEMLQRSVHSFRRALNLEIAAINERINTLGGGTWRQLLALFLKQGSDPTELVVALLYAIEEPLYRREIVNTMTNGLQDLYDALLAEFENLQVEEADMNKRSAEMEELGYKQRAALKETQKQMSAHQEALAEPAFEEPEEEDDSEALAGAQAEMFNSKENALQVMMAELRRLKKVLEEWQKRVAAECDPEAMQALEDEIKDWKRRIRVMQMRGEKYDAATEAADGRVAQIQEKIERQRALSDELRTKLAGVPTINPASLMMQRLKRELKELNKEEKRIKAAMAGPNDRIMAMRAQLRDLYKKLGWEWDLSDSEGEDDGDEKPYWMRRKIAVNGFLPFDPREFNYLETACKTRRQKRAKKERDIDQTTLIVSQMRAKRQVFAGRQDERELDEEELGPALFDHDDPSRDLDDPVQRAITSARERLSLPGSREVLQETSCYRLAQHAEQGHTKRVELDRLLRLRESLEVQLQQCVECFVDLLPDSGSLGHLRTRLSNTLSKLHYLPEDPVAWEAEELEQELRDTCETLQSMIEEGISYGDQVHPISAAMMHSVRFSDLRVSLSEVLRVERKLRGALAAHNLSRRSDLQQYDESPPITPSCHLLTSTSSSPRVMRKTAPAGSVDEGSESSMFTPSAALYSRSIPSPDELSRSLTLPPRLMAQTYGGRKAKKADTGKKVDFGFRPDGGGEDSVENWSLFKVSKASTSTSGFPGDSVSTGFGLTTSSGFIGDKMRKTETNIRRQRAAADCDFHEFMSQKRQNDGSSWQTASAPSLINQGKKKLCPPLPKLVHSGSAGRNLSAANTFASVSKGDVLGSWDQAPPKVRLRKSVRAVQAVQQMLRSPNGEVQSAGGLA